MRQHNTIHDKTRHAKTIQHDIIQYTARQCKTTNKQDTIQHYKARQDNTTEWTI